jgi:hypothetical protein
MGRAARGCVLERYTWDDNLARLGELLGVRAGGEAALP